MESLRHHIAINLLRPTTNNATARIHTIAAEVMGPGKIVTRVLNHRLSRVNGNFARHVDTEVKKHLKHVFIPINDIMDTV